MTITNRQIITRMEADRIIARHMEKALPAVGQAAKMQVKHFDDGFSRMTWYASCFFENYDDVCNQLVDEDLRFLSALIELIDKQNIITRLVRPYIDIYIRSMSDEQKRDVIRLLAKASSHFTAGAITSTTFNSAITFAVVNAFNLRSAIAMKLTKGISSGATVFFPLYGQVALAAEKANELKFYHPIYYHVLYAAKIEMLYFLIEPVFRKNYAMAMDSASTQELADGLLRLIA